MKTTGFDRGQKLKINGWGHGKTGESDKLACVPGTAIQYSDLCVSMKACRKQVEKHTTVYWIASLKSWCGAEKSWREAMKSWRGDLKSWRVD